jgi:hypothetical protein
MIRSWLPKAFKGFDKDLIDGFAVELKDQGGFVTLQDLIDSHDGNKKLFYSFLICFYIFITSLRQNCQFSVLPIISRYHYYLCIDRDKSECSLLFND